ncbi:hypothetical protein [Streptomyces sp. NPDC003697]
MGAGQARHDKPPLGGTYPPVRFTDAQAAVLGSLADAVIPGGGGFPSPSDVNVVGFFGRYTTPRGESPQWYPCIAEDDLKRRLDDLAEASTPGDAPGRSGTPEALERDDPAFFALLRDVVYFAYYSRPEVTRAINVNIPAGRDYRNSPQPYGYLDGLEEWDDAMLDRVRGTYLRTDQVRRLEHLPAYDDAAPGAAGTAAGLPDEEASVH